MDLNPYAAFVPEPGEEGQFEPYIEWLRWFEDATANDREHLDQLCEEWGWTWADFGSSPPTGLVPFLRPGAEPRGAGVKAEAAALFTPFRILHPSPLDLAPSPYDGGPPVGHYPYPVFALGRLGEGGQRWKGDDDDLERREAFYSTLTEAVRGSKPLELLDHVGRFGAQHEALTRMIEQYGAMIWGDDSSKYEEYGLGTSARMLAAWYEHARARRGAEPEDRDGLYWSTNRLWSALVSCAPPDDGLRESCAAVLCGLGDDPVLGGAVARGVLHIQAGVNVAAKQATRIEWKRAAVGAVLHSLALDRVPPPFAELDQPRAGSLRPDDGRWKDGQEAEDIARDVHALYRYGEERFDGTGRGVTWASTYAAVIEVRGLTVTPERVRDYRDAHKAEDMDKEEQDKRAERLKYALPYDVKRFLK